MQHREPTKTNYYSVCHFVHIMPLNRNKLNNTKNIEYSCSKGVVNLRIWVTRIKRIEITVSFVVIIEHSSKTYAKFQNNFEMNFFNFLKFISKHYRKVLNGPRMFLGHQRDVLEPRRHVKSIFLKKFLT